MSTTYCGTNIVRIRVGLFNDILRFDYALCIFFIFLTYYYGLTSQQLRLPAAFYNNRSKPPPPAPNAHSHTLKHTIHPHAF